MTILRSAKVCRTFRAAGQSCAVQANARSAAWPIYDGTLTGAATAALATPNTAGLLVAHNSGTAVIFRFGVDATTSVGPNSGGVHHLAPGEAVLFDEAEMDSLNATWIAIAAPAGSAKVTFLRVATSKLITFDSPGDTFDPSDAPNASGGAVSAGYFGANVTLGTAILEGGPIQTTGLPT